MPFPLASYYNPYYFTNGVSKVVNAVVNDPIRALQDKHLYAAIGFFSLFPLIKNIVKGIYYNLQATSLKTIATRYKPSIHATGFGGENENSYVVITGATAGIGKAFAETFAKLGFNLVLIGRSQEKLDAMELEILAIDASVKVVKICVDFTQTYKKSDLEEAVISRLNGLDISILVNNVAVGECYAFHDLSAAKIFRIIHTNVYPQVYLTRLLIGRLNARSATHRTAIINISSNLGTEVFLPYFSVYSATKAFNDHFSKVLSVEFPKLDVLSARPGRTQTNMNPKAKTSPEDQVKAILRSLGVKNETTGTFRSFLEAYFGPSTYWLVKGVIRSSINRTYTEKYRTQLLAEADLPVA